MAESDRRKVLVVDDVSVDRKLLSRFLEKDGYQVSLAYDGRQALQLLRAEHGIDLVGLGFIAQAWGDFRGDARTAAAYPRAPCGYRALWRVEAWGEGVGAGLPACPGSPFSNTPMPPPAPPRSSSTSTCP